jgi:hypothetical protein
VITLENGFRFANRALPGALFAAARFCAFRAIAPPPAAPR